MMYFYYLIIIYEIVLETRTAVDGEGVSHSADDKLHSVVYRLPIPYVFKTAIDTFRLYSLASSG